MRNIRFPAFLIAFAIAAVPSLASVNVGDSIPSLTVDKWYNLPKGKTSIGNDDLKGQIVVVEFWATWCQPCRESIPHLAELQKKYKKKGVIILGISNEPEPTVKSFLDKNKHMDYVVAAGGEDLRNTFGVDSFPTAFLVSPDGKVVWRDHPAVLEAALEKALSETPAKGRSFLASSSAKSLLKQAGKYYKTKKYEEALETYKDLADQFPESTEGKKAKSRLKKMEKNSSIMGKIRAAKAEREAEKWLNAARALVQYGDASDAAKYYKRILKKYPATKCAKYARSEMDAIKDKITDDSDDGDSKKNSDKADSDDESDDSDDDSEDDDDDSSEDDD